MAKIYCEIEEIEMTGDYGNSVAGVCARYPRCGHEVESFGTGDASIKRRLVGLSEECPKKERNFYVED